MKTPIKICVALVGFTGLLAGCKLLSSSGPQAAPTAIERKLADITTNVVPVLTTNVVYAPVTNPAGAVFMEAVSTNVTQGTQTNYTFQSNAQTQTAVGLLGMVGNFFGVGGLVTTGLGGLLSWYWKTRSRQSTAVAGALAQANQTAQAIIAGTPQGQTINMALQNWMHRAHLDNGIAQAVAAIIDSEVDPGAAQGAATSIVNSILGTANTAKAPAPAPTAPLTTAAPAPSNVIPFNPAPSPGAGLL